MKIVKSKGILTPFQKEIITEFCKIKNSDFFYLTGGTALSDFYFAHRRSYDLDFFTNENGLIIPFSQIFEKEIERKYRILILKKFENFVEYEVKNRDESIVIRFAYDTPFRFAPPDISDIGIKINDYEDLIIDKLLTFFSRWKHRDAIDLYWILKKEPIELLISMAEKKDPNFDIYWFCIALNEVKNFPDEIEKWPVEILIPFDVKDLKNKFIETSMRLMDKIKKK